MEVFLAVAQERSFSRAAAKLRRTQPAVSQVIAKLEAELGEVLLDRSARDGSLTDAGQVLFGYAEKMLNLRGDAQAALADLRSLQQGKLQIAANEYTVLYLLPVLDAFRREHAGVSVAVHRSLASRIPDDVMQHSVEMGIVSFRPTDPQLRSVVVYRDELVCIVAPEHELAGKRRVSIARLGRESFVAHNVPSPVRQKVIEAFGRQHTPLKMDVQLPSLEAIKRYVQRGNGVALVPRLTVEAELASGALWGAGVPELQTERKLRLIYREQAELSHAARSFLKVVKQHAITHGPPFHFAPERDPSGAAD